MKPIFLAAALGIISASCAQAQPWQSVYTETDLDLCTMIGAYELGASWACPGYKGFPLLVSEGDLRFLVSYGFGAADEKAARQTFPQFNHLGARLEWLLAEDDTLGTVPVGTILRYFLAAPDYNDPDFQVLVVTRIEAGNTCQVAHIDALANANANQMARDAAIALIPGFDCKSTDPVVVGTWRVNW